MKIDDKDTSFRQWNPEKVNVPWGEDNGSYTEADDKGDSAACGSCCCFIPGLIEKIFKHSFQEVVNVMKPGIVMKNEIIKEFNA